MAELTVSSDNLKMYRKPVGHKQWMVYGRADVTTSGGHVVTGLTEIKTAVGGRSSGTNNDIQLTRNSDDGTLDKAGNDGNLWLDVDSNTTVSFMVLGTRTY